jgi:hypothetical protein
MGNTYYRLHIGIHCMLTSCLTAPCAFGEGVVYDIHIFTFVLDFGCLDNNETREIRNAEPGLQC